jgi:tripartite-type tricarboxylate transporter receptor subunit TctC
VFVPAGTAQPVIAKLAAAFERIMEMPETTEFLHRLANEPFPGSPDSLRTLLAKEIERWGELIKLAGIPPQ